MKKIISFLSIPIALLISCDTAKLSQQNPQDRVDATRPVVEVINEIQNQYSIAWNKLGTDTAHIRVLEVDVAFDVTNASAINGQLGVVVASGKYARTASTESTDTFSLLDTTTHKNTFAPHDKTIHTLTEDLANIIYNSAKSFESIKSAGIGHAGANKFEIDITFSVEKDGSLDVKIPLGVFSTEGGYQYSHKNSNSIKLVFEVQ